MYKILFLTLTSVLFGVATGLYSSPDTNVILLTTSNFEKLVLEDKGIWIIKFFATWCPHCINLKSDYEKVANALKGIIKVGAIDIDDHGALAELYKIESFPKIKIFGADKSEPIDFKGARNAKNIIDAALNVARKDAYQIAGIVDH